MNIEKAASLLSLGTKLGLQPDIVLETRRVWLESNSLAGFLKEKLDGNKLTPQEVLYLLACAFDMRAGDSQSFVLWYEGQITDARFDTYLRASIGALP